MNQTQPTLPLAPIACGFARYVLHFTACDSRWRVERKWHKIEDKTLRLVETHSESLFDSESYLAARAEYDRLKIAARASAQKTIA